MKEFDVARVVAVINSMAFIRANLIWQPTMNRVADPIVNTGTIGMLDKIIARKMIAKEKESRERGAQVLAEHSQSMHRSIKAALDGAVEELESLSLNFTLAEVRRVRARFEESGTPPGQHEFDDIFRRLSDELRQRNFLAIDIELSRYLKPELFGNEVRTKFPSTIYEIDEAAKCLAVSRSTACVFHLMRVMEIAVRSTARCLGIPDPTLPAQRNWGSMFSEIKSGMTAKWPNAAARMSGDGQFFESLMASLEAVKNPWRNSTMHVERTYTTEEAERIWNAVEGLLKTCARRFDEGGLPLA